MAGWPFVITYWIEDNHTKHIYVRHYKGIFLKIFGQQNSDRTGWIEDGDVKSRPPP